jgi:hypothetical protein
METRCISRTSARESAKLVASGHKRMRFNSLLYLARVISPIETKRRAEESRRWQTCQVYKEAPTFSRSSPESGDSIAVPSWSS